LGLGFDMSQVARARRNPASTDGAAMKDRSSTRPNWVTARQQAELRESGEGRERGGAEKQAVEARLERLAWFLDSSVPVPGTRWSLGFDSLIGLIPGIGDAVGAAISLYLVFEAHRLGVSRATLLRMLGNVGLEVVVGAVPVIGDLFDAYFKANQRNVDLIRGRTAGNRDARSEFETDAEGGAPS